VTVALICAAGLAIACFLSAIYWVAGWLVQLVTLHMPPLFRRRK
jgi:hypothetical protein